MNNIKQNNHIVFLINSMGEGGAQRVILSLVEEYLSHSIEVTLISLVKNDFYEIPIGVNKVYLREKASESSGFYETLLIPYYAWKLKRYVKNKKIKIVQSHLFRANFVNLISKLFSSKQIVQIVNHSVISRFLREGLFGRANIFLIRILYPKADKVFYISKRMKEDFLFYVKGIDKKNIIIYNPYNISQILEQSKENVDFTFNPKKLYLVTVGRLITLKRFKDILLVLSTLDEDIELVMLGNGEKEAKLKALANDLNIMSRVHFLGQVKNPFYYISRSDLFISSSSVEGFPNVLVEAMICRTAIISTDCVSGPREILAPKTDHSYQLTEGLEMAEFGILYPVGKVDELKKAILLLLKDEKLRKEYETKAFEQSKNFSIEKISKIYKEAYFK